MRKLSSKNFTSNFSGTPVKTTLHSVSVERGMTWEKALLMWREHAGPDDGFYLSAQVSLYLPCIVFEYKYLSYIACINMKIANLMERLNMRYKE